MLTLRPYQQKAVDAVYDHLRRRDDNPCVVIPTAGGKTPVMATICRDAVQRWGGRVLILAHVKELLEQAVEKLTHMAPDLWMQIGVYSAGLKSRDTDKPITVAGIQSVYRRAAELDRFDLVIVDECFPGGTLISTPRGDVPIDEIYVGQPVHTALGIGEVEIVSGRTTDRLIELEMEVGRTIRCTPSHPFFTEQGWRKAETLEVGSRLFSREDVQALRDVDAAANLSQPGRRPRAMHIRNGVEPAYVLLREMRGSEETQDEAAPSAEVAPVAVGTNPLRHQDLSGLRRSLPALDQDGSKRQCDQPSEGDGLEAAAFLLDLLRQEGGECGIATRGPREAQPDIAAYRPRAGLSRRKRPADCASGADVDPTGPRVAGGVCGSDRSSAHRWDAHEHQARHRPSETADRHRTGWSLPWDPQEPKGGPAADAVLASQRVARIAHIQCESPVPVFNLQISGHPSYYADGVLAHNCHMIPPSGDGMYRQFLADAKVVNPNVRLIGLTATPYRMSSGTICGPVSKNLLNHVCFEVGVKELIVQGYLCPLKSKAGRRKADTSGLHIRGGEFVAGEVEALMDEDSLVRSACREIIEHTRRRRAVLIFAAGVQHAQHVQRTLGELGHECGFVCGETLPFERAETLRRFKDGELKYLVNVNVLTTGFDAPNIDCVALLRPTNSPGLYYQMVGRGFRLHPDKDDCLVLDFAGNIVRHGPVDALKLDDPSKGDGEAPAKECPQCNAVIHAAYSLCPDCGYEFPPPERQKHEQTASTAGVLSGEVTTEEHHVSEVAYSAHHKRGAPPDHPRTLRVEYRIGLNRWQSEWVCFEHTGYARAKAESWWRQRSNEPVPETAEQAVAICAAGGVCQTHNVTIRSVSGEKYDRVVGYDLGPKPPRLDGSDERDLEDMPAYAWAGDELPF